MVDCNMVYCSQKKSSMMQYATVNPGTIKHTCKASIWKTLTELTMVGLRIVEVYLSTCILLSDIKSLNQ